MSNQCAKPWPEIRKFCQDFADLKIELANALEEDRLAGNVDRLKKEIASLTQSGGGQPRDSQAALIATLTGFQEHTAENILSFAVALLVELGAAFGLYLATGWLPATAVETPLRGRDGPEPTPKFPASESVVKGQRHPFNPSNPEPVANDIPSEDIPRPEALPNAPKERKKRTSKKNLENLKPMRLQIGEDGVLRASDE
jgi:hypothetical protein